jgi:hypothetical protein
MVRLRYRGSIRVTNFPFQNADDLQLTTSLHDLPNQFPGHTPRRAVRHDVRA